MKLDLCVHIFGQTASFFLGGGFQFYVFLYEHCRKVDLKQLLGVALSYCVQSLKSSPPPPSTGGGIKKNTALEKEKIS